MEDIPHQAPDTTLEPRDRAAFAWAFGVCTAVPLVGAALMAAESVLGVVISGVGLYLLIASPVLWVGVFVAGLAMRVSGRAARGNRVMLGALAGAVVGFSLCSGILIAADGGL